MLLFLLCTSDQYKVQKVFIEPIYGMGSVVFMLGNVILWVLFFMMQHEGKQMTLNLFENDDLCSSKREELSTGVVVLREFATPVTIALLSELQEIISLAPFRHMITPNGYKMSVAMTNCGSAGWTTDRKGYRYTAFDPLSGNHWPAMPATFLQLATRAATQAGFDNFMPDACLINRYEPGAKLSLHQDKNERDFTAPIVSVSLGLPATFLLGGLARTDKPRRIALFHGDVVVWGGKARLFYHGVMPLKEGSHAVLGRYRINLTFRKAL